MPERTLTVRIIGDDSSLQRAFARDAKASQTYGVQVAGLGRSFLKAGIAAGVATVSFQTAAQVIGDSIGHASDLNEELAKSEQIFGDFSDEVEAWSKTTADAFGIAQVEALQATGTFGNLFTAIGITAAKSSEMSTALVELAADMASFNNADPSDVLLAIRSGLVGEAEPLRRYGVFLSEARVQQVALAETGKESVKQLTNQEKAFARYEIILQDTQKAQGDVARTSDSLANQQRKLHAQVVELETALGQALIPVMLGLVTTMNDAASAARNLLAWLDKIGALDVIKVILEIELSFIGPGGPREGFRKIGDLTKGIAEEARSAVESALSDTEATVDAIERMFSDGADQWKFLPSAAAEERRQAEKSADSVFDEIFGSIEGPLKKIRAALDARAKALREAALEAGRARRRAEHAFDEFLLGMGLKLDIAGISASEEDDLAVLRETEAGIQRRIARVGRTFKLAQDLARVQGQIAQVTANIAADAAQDAEDAWDDILDALNLKLDIAESTRGFNDDMRALRAIENQILARIRAEGRTTELARLLFENRQAQQETLRQARNAAAFEELGLTAEGERPTPSGAALLKRAKGLREQIKGTVLDTPKTRQELTRIVNYLKHHLRTAGKEVRDAILGMLNDISSALDQDKPKGPLTKFAKTGIGKLIEGLGLSEEQVRELRARMSAVGPGMSVPAQGTGAFGSRVGGGAQVGPARGPREDDFVFHIYIDGAEVESRVTRRQQKKQGRNGRSRRGTRPGR